jgi:hypothetical protein
MEYWTNLPEDLEGLFCKALVTVVQSQLCMLPSNKLATRYSSSYVSYSYAREEEYNKQTKDPYIKTHGATSTHADCCVIGGT